MAMQTAVIQSQRGIFDSWSKNDSVWSGAFSFAFHQKHGDSGQPACSPELWTQALVSHLPAASHEASWALFFCSSLWGISSLCTVKLPRKRVRGSLCWKQGVRNLLSPFFLCAEASSFALFRVCQSLILPGTCHQGTCVVCHLDHEVFLELGQSWAELCCLCTS